MIARSGNMHDRADRAGKGHSARSSAARTPARTEIARYNERFPTGIEPRMLADGHSDLKAQIARLPEQPGVYLYFNEAGETIYVGKARSLRDRVRSYLGAYGMSPRDRRAARRSRRASRSSSPTRSSRRWRSRTT